MAGAENQSGAGNGDRGKEDTRLRLDALKGKLAKAKGQRSLQETPEGRGKAMGQALKLATELVAGVVVGGLIGWALDQLFGTKPFLMLLFLFLGAAAGIMNVVRTATKMQGEIYQGEPMPGHHLRSKTKRDAAAEDDKD